jgi:hypothetical protein
MQLYIGSMSSDNWTVSYKKEEKLSTYVLGNYRVFFSNRLARKYEPIVYSGLCISGDPEAVYYRIVNNDKQEFCIQYFYYWAYQRCAFSSHGFDYEPIFVYLRNDSPDVYLIVNGGFGQPDCNFHKNEVRPSTGTRDSMVQRVTVNLSPYPHYPFGREGSVEYSGCIKTYPLNGDDLQFEDMHPVFGIRSCSNVFSGSEGYLHGDRFKSPLKKLTDRILTRWYFHHYEKDSDMPFGHDIADPFSSPYIKFHKPTKDEVEELGRRRRRRR